jgi:hypothetical protein
LKKLVTWKLWGKNTKIYCEIKGKRFYLCARRAKNISAASIEAKRGPLDIQRSLRSTH